MVRTILFAAEREDWRWLVPQLTHRELGYHAKLLSDEGFIEAAMTQETGKGCFHPVLVRLPTLTWKGHDFLDATRADAIWEKVKAKMKGIGGFTAELILDTAKDYLKAQIGLS